MKILKKIFKRIFSPKNNNVRSRDGEPDVYDISGGSERMNWAMEKARLTFDYFNKCLDSPKSSQDYFSIKVRVEDGDKIEHIWLTDPIIDDKKNIIGVVGNNPVDVKNVELGQKIKKDFSFLSDWMIIENGRLIGGYTIRAIRHDMNDEEKENFDRNVVGVFIDEGEDYFLANFETPEGAILSIENAYIEKNLEKAINCKNFKKEAELMLKENIEEKIIDNEIIQKTAETLELSFRKDIKKNGFPKFDKIKRAFERNFITPEYCIITETIYYQDWTKSKHDIGVYMENGEWKVLNPR